MFKFAACLILSAFLGRVAGSEATVNLEARDVWSDQVLSEHNKARDRYGAKPLQWSTPLFPSTNQYAQMCKFAHSDAQSRYGENLYASSNLNAGIADAIKSWMAEASKYDYNHPGYNLATGHFTQVVWKDTTQVACALASCAAGTIFPIQPSKYIVCRYTPPGNYAGQFAQNVGRPA